MALARTKPELTETGYQNSDGSYDLPSKSLSTMVLPNKTIPKAEVSAYAGKIVETLGEFLGGMERFILIKQASEILKSACEQSLDSAMLNMRGREMECIGAVVKIRALTEYEYNDSALAEMEKQAEELKAKIDDRRKFLRALKEPMANTTTGEIIEPAKKIRDGQTLSVTFK